VGGGGRHGDEREDIACWEGLVKCAFGEWSRLWCGALEGCARV